MKIEMNEEKNELIKTFMQTFGLERMIIIGADAAFSQNHRYIVNMDNLQGMSILRIEAARLEKEFNTPPTFAGVKK